MIATGPSGITLACGYKNRPAIQQTLLQATELQRLKTGATEWVGFGVGLYAPDDPVVLYYSGVVSIGRFTACLVDGIRGEGHYVGTHPS